MPCPPRRRARGGTSGGTPARRLARVGDEGEELIDSDVYLLTEAQTSKSVTFTLPPGFDLDADDVVVAVATDAEGRSSEFSFGQLQITVSDAPDPFPAGIPFSVEVVATATSGPFKPNGTVLVSMNTSPATTCTMTLQPTATALTSAGSCELLPLQVGSRTITATYQTLAGAFSSATGDNVTAIAAHTVTDPGPEQISFASCAAVGIEGRELVVEVRRPSGGVAAVQVDLTHEAGTATPGTDYAAPADQTLIWAPGDFAPKLIGIPIDADALVEPVETFRLRLSNPVNASILPTALTEIRIRNGVDAGFADGFEGSCVN